MSLRDIAVKNAAPGSLLPDPAYCPECGQPLGTGLPHSHYKPDSIKMPDTPKAGPDPRPFK